MYRLIHIFKSKSNPAGRMMALLLLFSLSDSAFASRGSDSDTITIRSLFENIPDTIIPLISHVQLLDFSDYLSNNMKAEVKNRLGSMSEMTILTEDYSHIRLTPSSDLQIQLLPYKSDKVVLIVHSYFLNDSTADSTLRFYDLKWKPLPAGKYRTLIDKTEHPRLQIHHSKAPTITPLDTETH